MSVRNGEHFHGAKAEQASSHFYRLYPSKQTDQASTRGKQGLFENLEMMLGAAYDPKSDAAKVLDKDWTEGEILILSDSVKKEIKESMRKLSSGIKKFHHIASYQIELGYDLAICPGLNASHSPGYESVLGVFGGED